MIELSANQMTFKCYIFGKMTGLVGVAKCDFVSELTRPKLFFDIHNVPHSPTTKHTQSGAIIFFVYTKNESRVWLFSISRSKAALVGDFFSRALWDLERSRAILRKGTPPRAHLPCAVISIHLKGEAHP
mgnify:CR=1 FL=1